MQPRPKERVCRCHTEQNARSQRKICSASNPPGGLFGNPGLADVLPDRGARGTCSPLTSPVSTSFAQGRNGYGTYSQDAGEFGSQACPASSGLAHCRAFNTSQALPMSVPESGLVSAAADSREQHYVEVYSVTLPLHASCVEACRYRNSNMDGEPSIGGSLAVW